MRIQIVRGYIRHEDAKAALQAGVQEVISKPHSIQELGNVLHNELERQFSGKRS